MSLVLPLIAAFCIKGHAEITCSWFNKLHKSVTCKKNRKEEIVPEKHSALMDTDNTHYLLLFLMLLLICSLCRREPDLLQYNNLNVSNKDCNF